MPVMDISKICFLILKAREFDVREEVVEEDYGGNPIDESFRETLAARADDPTYDEIKEQIDDMHVDEQCQLVALSWLGRGKSEWGDALRLARDLHNEHTAEYLLGMPLLGDYLEERMAAFDLHCDE